MALSGIAPAPNPGLAPTNHLKIQSKIWGKTKLGIKIAGSVLKSPTPIPVGLPREKSFGIGKQKVFIQMAPTSCWYTRATHLIATQVY